MSRIYFIFLGCLMGWVASAQVVNIEEQRITGTHDSIHWYGYFRGSAAFVKVRDQSFQFQSQAKVQYKSAPHLVLLLLNANLLRAGNNDIARRAFAHLRYNYKMSETLTGEAFVQVQNSPIQLLEQRNLYGVGLRHRLLKSKDGRQRVYAGVAWVYEHNRFTEPNGFSNQHRSSNYLSATFRPNAATTLIQTTYWQPVWGMIKNYRLSSEWVLKWRLGKRLAFSVEFDYNVDWNLPADAPQETIGWRNGLSWEF